MAPGGGQNGEADAQASEHLPVNFGKRLAHTDKTVRDRGFRTLKKWLQRHTDLDRLEYMKLWRGLYFCMWMSDKRPVQQELAVNIALLLNDVPAEKQDMWFDCFWETMHTGWEKLDVHRMNKYLLFARICVAEAFKAQRLAGWRPERLKAMAETFLRSSRGFGTKATTQPSIGYLLQFTRVFWAELLPQLEQKPKAKSEAVMLLVEPFCVLADDSPVQNLVKHIHENVLRKAPPLVHAALTARVLQGAARAEVIKDNREALYETADVLEREQQRAAAESALAAAAAAAAAAQQRSSPRKSPRSPAASGAAGKGAAASPAASGAAASAEAAGRKGKKRKKKATAKSAVNGEGQDEAEETGGSCFPSPLLLPKSAVPVSLPRKSIKKKKRAKTG